MYFKHFRIRIELNKFVELNKDDKEKAAEVAFAQA